jgi:hypothetical protein
MATDWLGIFRRISPMIKIALGIVERSTDDANIDVAIQWVNVAMGMVELSNDERRAFVVKMLTQRGLSENVARMLVEISVAVVKERMKASA